MVYLSLHSALFCTLLLFSLRLFLDSALLRWRERPLRGALWALLGAPPCRSLLSSALSISSLSGHSGLRRLLVALAGQLRVLGLELRHQNLGKTAPSRSAPCFPPQNPPLSSLSGSGMGRHRFAQLELVCLPLPSLWALCSPLSPWRTLLDGRLQGKQTRSDRRGSSAEVNTYSEASILTRAASIPCAGHGKPDSSGGTLEANLNKTASAESPGLTFPSVVPVGCPLPCCKGLPVPSPIEHSRTLSASRLVPSLRSGASFLPNSH